MADSPTTPWALYRRAFTRHRPRLVGSCALLSSWNVCEALVPVVIGIIIDRAVTTGDLSTLATWSVVLCALFTVLTLSYRFGSRLGYDSVQRETHNLRVELAGHVLHERGTRSTRVPGELLSIATSDAEKATEVIRELGYAVAGVMSIAVSAVYLLRTDVALGAVILIGVPLVLGVIQLLGPVISRRAEEQQESIAHASGVASDLVRGLRVIKGIGGETAASRRYREASAAARDASIHTSRSIGQMYGITTALSGVFLAAVALLAGRLALEGSISIGELIAIVGITQFLAEPITMLSEISAHGAASVASARRIVTELQTPHLIDEGTTQPAATYGSLTLVDVSTGPLSHLSFAVTPGELVGIVIEDPAASDRLVALLAGEIGRDQRAGSVLLDDTDIADMAVDTARRRLVVSQHHVDLFEGTLRSNVDMSGSVDDVTLQASLQASAAADVIALRAGGIDQVTTAYGATYSGGQRQRIALARALASEAPVLVLQEPTTAVDAMTEQRIAKGVRSLRHAGGSTCTTIVLTSSPAVLTETHRALLVRDGSITASGTHSELSGRDDYRAAVWR